MARSAEARKMLADLDEELAAASRRSGQAHVWTASERGILALISEQIDRKCDLQRAYRKADEVKLQIKLSTEIRLIEAQLARLYKQISPEVPAVPTGRSLKGQRAAHARWEARRNA